MQPIQFDNSSRSAIADSLNFFIAPDSLRDAVSESFDSHLQTPPPNPPPEIRPVDHQAPKSASDSPVAVEPVEPAPSTYSVTQSGESNSTDTAQLVEGNSQTTGHNQTQDSNDGVPEAVRYQQRESSRDIYELDSQAGSDSSMTRRGSRLSRATRPKPPPKKLDGKPDDKGTRRTDVAIAKHQSIGDVSVSASGEIKADVKNEQEEETQIEVATSAVAKLADASQLDTVLQPDAVDLKDVTSDAAQLEASLEKPVEPTVAVEIAPSVVWTSSISDPDSTGESKRIKSSNRSQSHPSDLSAVGDSLVPREVAEMLAEQIVPPNTELEGSAEKLVEVASQFERPAGQEPNSTPVSPQLRFVQHLAAKPSERTTKTAPISNLEQARLIDRVARAFRTAEGRDGSVTLRLHPPELGILRVELKVQEGSLSARLEAETPAARSLLMDNVEMLRDRLAEQGVRIERFDVELLDQNRLGDGPAFEQHGMREQHNQRTWTNHRAATESNEPESTQPPPRPSAPGKLNVIV